MAKRSAKRGPRKRNPTRVAVSALVEAVSEQVMQQVRRELPTRDAFNELRRDVRRIGTRVERANAGRPRRGRPPSNRKCTVRGCEEKHVAHGYCSKHYQQWRRQQQGKAVRKK